MLYCIPTLLLCLCFVSYGHVNSVVVFVLFCKPVKLLVLSSGQQLSLALVFIARLVCPVVKALLVV